MSAYTQSDYQAIEAAVQESPRGRWFLGEFARRNRAADTLMLLEAIRKLERGVAADVPGEDFWAKLQGLSQTIDSVLAGDVADPGEQLSDVKRLIDGLLADRSVGGPRTPESLARGEGGEAPFEKPAPAPSLAALPAKDPAAPGPGSRGDAKNRIVFIRRASSAEAHIPLADEADEATPADISQPGS